MNNGYPWWSSVAHSLDAEIVVTVLKKRLTLETRLPETHILINSAQSATVGEHNNADPERALLAKELDVMMDGNSPSASSKLCHMSSWS